MVSLQEQLMKAGLVDKKKVNKAKQDKSKQWKEELRTGEKAADQAREAVLEQQRKQAERARELNAQRDAAASQKAIMAQVVQMVQQHRQSKGKGDVPYNFTFGSKIERIHVSAAVQQHLVNGRLVIVVLDDVAELVPRVVAEKIAERAPEVVVSVKKAASEPAEDDPYADYKIPDDFTW
ncbi:DUF2058 family protein [Pseudoduganella sp. DS3]|uniref:DUF2058 family protein n=1 Tax=Pseudoduganella guangdongensis TaxID=2692179 RepID=A0A6N9HGT5_9BURK|nr:DUF2058 domain-containing protein [Pseudoduganella guangdongensis]MYN02660.1 DUF2058 family protein [Pseudoduganella guangdongensis]